MIEQGEGRPGQERVLRHPYRVALLHLLAWLRRAVVVATENHPDLRLCQPSDGFLIEAQPD